MFKKSRITALLLTLSMSATLPVQAAFPVKNENVVTGVFNTTSVEENAPAIEFTQLKKELKKPAPAPKKTGGNNKSHVAAILLAFFLGGFGVHRFYLGYTWQGILQALTFPLLIAAIAIAAAATVGTATISIPVAAIVCYFAAAALGVWEFVDFIRIIVKSLQPANGSYD